MIKTFKLWPKVSEGKMAKKSLKIQLKIQFEVLQFICSNEFEELQWYTDQVFFIFFFIIIILELLMSWFVTGAAPP